MTNNFITLIDKTFEELKQMNLTISCSCGKDSVALALCCFMDNIPIKYIVRYDNSADWGCMERVWEQLQDIYKCTDTKFITLKGTPLLEQMKQKHSYYLNGKKQFGIVPCGIFSRFGTNEKITMLENFSKDNNCVSVVGIAKDENRKLNCNNSYYLIEKGMTEKDCLELCYKCGFTWEQKTELGFSIRMYDFCSHLSCIYCSFSNCKELALIYVCFPTVWAQILEIQKISDVPFKEYSSAYNLPLRLTPYVEKLKLDLSYWE